MNSSVSEKVDAVAIIGMSGRFPGVRNCAEFWERLCAGTECLSTFSAAELAESGTDPAAMSHPAFVNAGGVIDDVDQFDAGFFEFSPREAEILDPQHRVFLECAWEALEMAGYDPQTYRGAIGVYGGAAMGTYLFNLLTHPELMAAVGSFQVLLANDKDHVTTRVAYKLNLKGPSVTVQTACSTSLVSVCLAVQSLLDHQCDMAMAGGVCIRVPQKTGYWYQEGMINSPDGHCRPFDAAAKGTVGGNGAGVVVLKRLAEAIQEGDSILAVIRGCAINNDGSLKVGYTAPSVEGQAEVIALAQAVADVAPETITYVEAHGTATPLGDPIEVAALTKAFRAGTNKKQFCAIGSVKSNIGHLDPAAGVAGLIKTILMLQHKALVPTLHFKQANPQIDFSNSPFYVNTHATEWKNGPFPRRAGVSSFGIGGTNAHVVLEEAPVPALSGASRREQLLLLSAKTASALESATKNLTQFLRDNPAVNLADVAYTTKMGRRAFAHRRFVVCREKDEAIQALTSLDSGRVGTRVVAGVNRPVAFLFPGQGAQYFGMGRELYQTEPVFRESVDQCAELLQSELGVDIRTILFPSPHPSPEEAARVAECLEQTQFTQPALFVVEYALARMWMHWKISPQALMGHSIGEYVAACIAGVFSVRDALRVVSQRARLMQQMPPGAMLAVGASESETRTWMGAALELAAVNGPQITVVSGPIQEIDSLQERLASQGVFCHRLRTSHAFHSRLMDPVVDQFAAVMATVALQPPQIPYVSNLTGTWIRNDEATDPLYWARHLRQTVQFTRGVETMREKADWVFLEVGPGRTLIGLTQQCLGPSAKTAGIASLGKAGADPSEAEALVRALGELWLSGAGIDWRSYYSNEVRRRISLPTYPFERARYWIDRSGAGPQSGTRTESGIDKRDPAEWFYLPEWETSLVPRLPQPPFSKGCCLVFDNGSEITAAIERRLTELKQEVIRVRPGPEFRATTPGEFVIDPLRPEHYGKLLSHCSQAGLVPTRVLHLWNCTPDNSRPTGLEDRLRLAETSFYSLLFLAQAIGESQARPQVRLVIAANNTAIVDGQGIVCPEKATALGPGKVIAQEYPLISCSHVDVVHPGQRASDAAALIDQLTGELWSASSDTVVAYRGAERWILRPKPLRLGSTPQKPDVLREGGVYLITGGLGGIGLALAEHLARTVRARIILLGRAGLPARDQWRAWLQGHSPDDRTSERIRQVERVESRGGEVLVLVGDVADETQMRSVLDQTLTRFGALHGIIHAAGVPGAGIIQVKSRSLAESVLRPKVRGTLVLEKLWKEIMPLDFVAICSSLSSWIGGVGQVDYCAANAFLDAYAHAASNERGPRVVSINWDTWQEVGMAVNTAVPRALESARYESLRHGMTSLEGCAVFDRVLALGQPQVVICTKGSGFLEPTAAPSFATRETNPKMPERSAASQYPRPELKNPYMAPRDELEATLAQIWQDLLGVTPIGVEDNFFELGGHSLLAIQLIARVKETVRKDLTIRAIFDAPSVEGLAQLLRGAEQGPDLDRMRGLLDVIDQLPEEEVQKLLEDPELRSRLIFPSTPPGAGNAA